MLGFRYVLDPTGLMECLPRNAFRVAISAGVLEHIQAATAQQFVSNTASLSVRGGVGFHSITILDHLANYDRSVNPKQYLTFSEAQWRFWCENKLQYINRIHRSDWVRMFVNAGFSVLEERAARADVSGLRIHPRYQALSRQDIECTHLVLAVRKP